MIVTVEFCVDFQNTVQGISGTHARFSSMNAALLWIYQNQSVAGVCVLSRITTTRTVLGQYGPGFSIVEPIPQGSISSKGDTAYTTFDYKQG